MAHPSRRNHFTCVQCGGPFSVAVSVGHRKYCSRKCYFEGRTPQQGTCECCGKSIAPNRSFCSTECTGIVKRIPDGSTFGRLTVTGAAKCPDGVHIQYECRCSCGKITHVVGNSLRRGLTQSCGCIRTEQLRERATTHGKRHTPEYGPFAAAKKRCTNQRCPDYPFYGGRGIEFRFTSFEEFLAAIGTRPSLEYSIDRIDPNGHYEPGNVRWATRKQQGNNRRPRRKKGG